MANETASRNLTDELAGQVGRLQAEIVIMESFLKTVLGTADVPESIRLGAEYYAANVQKLREDGDL